MQTPLKPKLNGAQREELRQHIRNNDLDAEGIMAKYGISRRTVQTYYQTEGIEMPKGRPNKGTEAIKSEIVDPEPVEQAEVLPQEELIGSSKDPREELPIHELIGTPPPATDNRDWCGTCEQRGKMVYVDKSMQTCPGCGGVLQW